MASWFGWGGGASNDPSSKSDGVSPELQLHGDSFDNSSPSSYNNSTQASQQAADVFSAPVLALDQLKHAGVPINRQMTPYLQMDPSMFITKQPQYIMPEGGVTGKGRFEFALGHIGWAVGAGFGIGSMRGAFPEMMNKDTRALKGKPWLTRMANATVKHGSGYAQPAGSVVFMYSALEILLRQIRADDDLNSFAAGGLAGAIYRSPHGLRATGIGALAGTMIATIWTFANPDSRQRIMEMFGSN